VPVVIIQPEQGKKRFHNQACSCLPEKFEKRKKEKMEHENNEERLEQLEERCLQLRLLLRCLVNILEKEGYIGRNQILEEARLILTEEDR